MQTKCPLHVQLSGERESFEMVANKRIVKSKVKERESFEMVGNKDATAGIFCRPQSADFRKGRIPSVCVFNEVQLRSSSFLIYIPISCFNG